LTLGKSLGTPILVAGQIETEKQVMQKKNELEAAKRNLYDVFMIEQKADIFTAIRDIVSARPGIEMDPSI